jgi:hypothetical protein
MCVIVGWQMDYAWRPIQQVILCTLISPLSPSFLTQIAVADDEKLAAITAVPDLDDHETHDPIPLSQPHSPFTTAGIIIIQTSKVREETIIWSGSGSGSGPDRMDTQHCRHRTVQTMCSRRVGWTSI